MGIRDNFREWTCDKCGAVEYIERGVSRESEWGKIERVNADGVDVTRYFCPEHKAAYRQLAQEEDSAFNAWMEGKE